MTIRATILEKCKNLTFEQVPTPDWGEDVWVRGLTAAEHLDMAGKEPDPVSVCILCVCGEDGAQLFQANDERTLRDGPSRPVLDCSMAVLRLSGLLEDEDLAGNSDAAPSGDSPST